jgi:preprotein translocase subunit SecG
MNASGSGGQNQIFSRVFSGARLQRGMLFFTIIVLALVAFEIFNYSTTDYALTDLLGSQRFLGIRWATILSIAFCGIDFAGIARLFTPEQGRSEPTEVWYLFGAWLLAATMNATLTWWGVSIAIVNDSMASTSVIAATTLTRIVPIFVAVMVWLIRILIIGSLSYHSDRLFSPGARPGLMPTRQPGQRPSVASAIGSSQAGLGPLTVKPTNRPISRPVNANPLRNQPEPTYQSLSMAGRKDGNGRTRAISDPDSRR